MVDLPAAFQPKTVIIILFRHSSGCLYLSIHRETALKIITLYQRKIFISRSGTYRFKISRYFSVHTKHRIILFPSDRNQYRNTPHCPSVLKQHCIPFPIRSVYNSSLGNSLITISHIIIQHIAACEFSFQRIRHETCLHPFPLFSQRVNKEQIVFTVYFIKMSTFITKAGMSFVLDNNSVDTAFFRTAQIRIQFLQTNVFVSRCYVDSVIIIKQNGTVMIKALDITLFPRSFDRRR